MKNAIFLLGEDADVISICLTRGKVTYQNAKLLILCQTCIFLSFASYDSSSKFCKRSAQTSGTELPEPAPGQSPRDAEYK